MRVNHSCFWIIGLLVLVLVACQKERPREGELEHRAVREMGAAAGGGADVTFQSLSRERWEQIRKLQEQIRRQPRETAYRAELVALAYGPSWNTLFLTGAALMPHPGNGRPIPQYQAEQAAFVDAQRWAAYLQRWRAHPMEPDFGSLQAWQPLPSTVLHKEIRNDTLILFLAFHVAESGS